MGSDHNVRIAMDVDAGLDVLKAGTWNASASTTHQAAGVYLAEAVDDPMLRTLHSTLKDPYLGWQDSDGCYPPDLTDAEQQRWLSHLTEKWVSDPEGNMQIQDIRRAMDELRNQSLMATKPQVVLSKALLEQMGADQVFPVIPVTRSRVSFNAPGGKNRG